MVSSNANDNVANRTAKTVKKLLEITKKSSTNENLNSRIY